MHERRFVDMNGQPIIVSHHEPPEIIEGEYAQIYLNEYGNEIKEDNKNEIVVLEEELHE